MPLPPCRPLLPVAPPSYRRPSRLFECSRAHSPCGLRLNLNWALSLLAAVPGPHQQRIISSATADAKRTAVLGDAAPQHGDNRQGGISKEELGRATWTLLHTLAAQWPQQPTRQQQKDVESLVSTLTRIYPCAECAAHFREIVRLNPPSAKSQQALEQWMCEVHNSVNESLGKPLFNCRAAGLRWPIVDCDTAEACALQGADANGR